MKKYLLLACLMLSAAICPAGTITFGPAEVDNGQGGGQGIYGNPTTEWLAFGIEISSAYLYNDTRDTFDRIGLSQVGDGGEIRFLSPLSSLTFDYLVIDGFSGRYAIFDSNGLFIDAISPQALSGNLNDTHTFNAPDIAKLVFTGGAGFVNVSTLYGDGLGVDGQVPEPATMGALGLGLVAIAMMRKRKQ